MAYHEGFIDCLDCHIATGSVVKAQQGSNAVVFKDEDFIALRANSGGCSQVNFKVFRPDLPWRANGFDNGRLRRDDNATAGRGDFTNCQITCAKGLNDDGIARAIRSTNTAVATTSIER